MFKELFTEGYDEDFASLVASNKIKWAKERKEHEKYIQDFNQGFEKLAQRKTIAGKDFTVQYSKYGTIELHFTYGEHDWVVEFIDESAGSKYATTIQVHTPSKRGVTEKKVSGRNNTPEKIIQKLDKFFKTQSWK